MLNPNAPDVTSAFAYRVGQAWVTNALTETGPGTLVFESADHSFVVQLSSPPSFDLNTTESALAVVTSTALQFSNLSFPIYETGTNTLVFVTNDEGSRVRFY